ncbi:MAG TPA: energy-coupling factor transporter transmembrane component T [Anaerolineae bacterium]|nr:energy-coupling factor transporter transmembrane component T [Anaerolineae bacterium]
MIGWQTVSRDSLFTRLDFRSKLALMGVLTTVALLWENPLWGGILAGATLLACLVAGVTWRYLMRLLRLLAPFFIFILFMQGFFAGPLITARTGQTALTPVWRFPAHWPLVGGAMLSQEGLLYGLNIIFKTLTMTLVVPLAIFTTDINAMLIGLVQLRVPYKIAFVVSSALRFFPLLAGELRAILEAQQLRGLDVERLPLTRRLALYARVAVPLILGALVKSQQLEVVLQAKAFTGDSQRTYLHEARLQGADYGLMAGMALFLAAVLVAYFAWGVGRFGVPAV